MNKVILIGRLTKDPEIKVTQNQKNFCNFTVAVDRKFKDANGNRQADFINCVAWNNTATFVSQYFKKGNKIAVTGAITTRNYDDNNGNKVYVTEVLAEDIEFVESKTTTPQPQPQATAPAPVAPEMDIAELNPDNIELPFDF